MRTAVGVLVLETKGITDMITWVCGTALVLSIVSFIVFVASEIQAARTVGKAVEASSSAAKIASEAVQRQAAPAPTVPELTDLINALTGAINAIKSAGPGLAGLGASILFLGIAAWAARGA
jgi:hypothetical protein